MRVNYWATVPLEPQIEAISKEVFDLAAHFTSSRVFSINPYLRVRVSGRGRVLGFHPSLDLLLRPVIRALEASADVNHIYGEVAPWTYFRSLRRKPIVLTVASEKGDLVPEFLERCRVVTAQTGGMADRLSRFRSGRTRIELIYPGIDLSAFRPRPQTAGGGRPRILFATFPRTAGELAERGVHFMLDAAASLPDVDFIMVSRPWRAAESALSVVRDAIQARQLRNVELLSGVQADMSGVYATADFTIIPFATAGGGKECPRSLIESMACGVPVLISDVAPFSRFIAEQQCGSVFALTPESFGAALEAGLSRGRQLGESAARAARDHFDLRTMLRRYAAIYDSLI